jgi:eukaryotic-like serine/threonine-protein kinase
MRYEEEEYSEPRPRRSGAGTVVLLSTVTSVVVSVITVLAIQRWGLPDVETILARGKAPVSEPAADSSVRVPEVIGMRAEAADELLTARKLRLVIRERRADQATAAGGVIAQSPLAESRVSPGAEVAVVVSAGPAKRQVPLELLGMPLDEAKQTLTAAGLRVGPISESSEGEPGTVISALPDPGSAVEAGAVVALTVARAPVEVPFVVNLALREARARIEKAGLSVGQVSEIYNSRKRANRVLQQTPEPGIAAAPGSKVDLVVNQGD